MSAFANVYPTTKGITAIALYRFVDEPWLAGPRPRRLLAEAYACL